MKGGHNPYRLDVLALARSGELLAGEEALAGFPRVGPMHLGEPVVVNWSARAWRAPARSESTALAAGEELWLHLRAQARMALECQRCLQPVDLPLDVDRRFLFAESEQRAAALDEEVEDDVLVLDRGLDLMTLLEDELLLALPIVPLHEACEPPRAAGAGTDEIGPAAHPFAVLEVLKKRH